MTLVPLTEVAADQRPAIQAFRDAGAQSFQDQGSMERSRAYYETSAAANGLAPDAVALVEDVAIGVGEEQFGVRVYDPRPGARSGVAAPVIVFAHGGGWVIGSLETHDTICRRLATLTGLPVVAIDYRLGPEDRFPAAHVDSARAVAWIRDIAADRNWDPQQLITAGDSAGGGIATALAFEPSMLVEGTSVIAQVLMYPVVDLSAESAGYQRIAEGFPLTGATMRWFAENFLADQAAGADHRVSPLLAVRDAHAVAQPPAWVLTLGLDPLAEEGLEYAARLAEIGTAVELVHLPNHAHGLFTSAGKIRSGELQLESIAAFIARVLNFRAEGIL